MEKEVGFGTDGIEQKRGMAIQPDTERTSLERFSMCAMRVKQKQIRSRRLPPPKATTICPIGVVSDGKNGKKVVVFGELEARAKRYLWRRAMVVSAVSLNARDGKDGAGIEKETAEFKEIFPELAPYLESKDMQKLFRSARNNNGKFRR